MFLRLLSILGFLSWSLNLSAQQAKTLLWEVKGNGLNQSSYVFGTMHLLCEASEMMTDSLKAVVSRAGEVYFEIDMDNPGEVMGIFRYIRMKGDTKLSDLLTAEEYQRVKRYFEQNKTLLPLSMMERFKPYFVAVLLGEANMPCASRSGMEELILQQAKKEGKSINGLETIGFQAGVFDSIPYKVQAQELLKTIDEPEQQDSFSVKMAAIYKSQDLEKVEELTLAEEGGVGPYLDLFLYGRNRNWIAPMENAMKKQATLFAIGAAHLPGEKGVLNLLRKAGYTVVPVPNR